MEPARRSKRQKVPIDYARLDESGFSDCVRVQHRRLARAVLKWPDSSHEEPLGPNSSAAIVTPEELSAHVHRTGFQSPCIVRGSAGGTADALGIRLPEGKMTVQRLAEFIGPNHAINTIDVATQSEGPIYSMEEWVGYFSSPSPRKPLLNVVSLDLSETPLQDMIKAPSLVKELDLVGKVWPLGKHPIPKVQLYALMSVADCFMDFHMDFGGSSVWYHVLSGQKVFLLVPPSKGNLVMFEEWASSEKQASVFFAERAIGCHRVELLAGDTLFLPGGWPHSVVTPVDSLVIGGNFLTGYNLALQLEIWHMEERLKVRPKFRFPLYKHLMWHTASYYLELLQKPRIDEEITISQWEEEGVVCLWRSLQSWLQQFGERGEIPLQISDATTLLEDLEACLKNLGLITSRPLRKGSMKVRLLLRANMLPTKDEDLLQSLDESKWPQKELQEKSIVNDEDFLVEEYDEEFGSDKDYSVEDDLQNEFREKKAAASDAQEKNSLGIPQRKRTVMSSVKTTTSVKKLTKLNSTVRERLLKKIGLDPRIPLPSPKYKPDDQKIKRMDSTL